MTDPEDPTTLSDRLSCPQGSVHLIVGPVGAGKSTQAIALARAHRAVRLTLDDWMAKLFRPNRPSDGVVPWYAERAARCVDQIWRMARDVLGTGTSVVLEIGLLSRCEREAFYARVDEVGARLTLHVVDAPREERRARLATQRGTRRDVLDGRPAGDLRARERPLGAARRRRTLGACRPARVSERSGDDEPPRPCRPPVTSSRSIRPEGVTRCALAVLMTLPTSAPA